MKYYFFDLDNTLCESKEKISPQMKEALSKFDNVFVISGSTKRQIEWQLDGFQCEILALSGNETKYWNNALTTKETMEVAAHLKKIQAFFGYDFGKKDMVEYRGAQISASLVGHNADKFDKAEFDPKRIIRRKILEIVPLKSNSVDVRIGGTTCLDYTKKGCTKGDNLKRYALLKDISLRDCIYFGDSFGLGGNDESVIGVIPNVVKVKSPKETLELIY